MPLSPLARHARRNFLSREEEEEYRRYQEWQREQQRYERDSMEQRYSFSSSPQHRRYYSDEWKSRDAKERELAYRDSIKVSVGSRDSKEKMFSKKTMMRKHAGKHTASSIGSGMLPKEEARFRTGRTIRGVAAEQNGLRNRGQLGSGVNVAGGYVNVGMLPKGGAFAESEELHISRNAKDEKFVDFYRNTFGKTSLQTYETGFAPTGSEKPRNKGKHLENHRKCGVVSHIGFHGTGMGSNEDAFKGTFRGNSNSKFAGRNSVSNIKFGAENVYSSAVPKPKKKQRAQLAEKMLGSRILSKATDNPDHEQLHERRLFPKTRGGKEEAVNKRKSQISTSYMGGELRDEEKQELDEKRKRDIEIHRSATKALDSSQIASVHNEAHKNMNHPAFSNKSLSGLRITGKQSCSQISGSMLGGVVDQEEYRQFAHEFKNLSKKGLRLNRKLHPSNSKVVFGDDGEKLSEGAKWRQKFASHDKSIAYDDKAKPRGLRHCMGGNALVDHIKFGEGWGLSNEELKLRAQQSGKKRFIQTTNGQHVPAAPEELQVQVVVPPGALGAIFVAATNVGDGAILKKFRKIRGKEGVLEKHRHIKCGMRLIKINQTDVRDDPFTMIRKILLGLGKDEKTLLFAISRKKYEKIVQNEMESQGGNSDISFDEWKEARRKEEEKLREFRKWQQTKREREEKKEEQNLQQQEQFEFQFQERKREELQQQEQQRRRQQQQQRRRQQHRRHERNELQQQQFISQQNEIQLGKRKEHVESFQEKGEKEWMDQAFLRQGTKHRMETESYGSREFGLIDSNKNNNRHAKERFEDTHLEFDNIYDDRFKNRHAKESQQNLTEKDGETAYFGKLRRRFGDKHAKESDMNVREHHSQMKHFKNNVAERESGIFGDVDLNQISNEELQHRFVPLSEDFKKFLQGPPASVTMKQRKLAEEEASEFAI
eukprot:g2686.t1